MCFNCVRRGRAEENLQETWLTCVARNGMRVIGTIFGAAVGASGALVISSSTKNTYGCAIQTKHYFYGAQFLAAMPLLSSDEKTCMITNAVSVGVIGGLAGYSMADQLAIRILGPRPQEE